MYLYILKKNNPTPKPNLHILISFSVGMKFVAIKKSMFRSPPTSQLVTVVIFYFCFCFLHASLPTFVLFLYMCLFRYLPGGEAMSAPPPGGFYREGQGPSMFPNVYPSSPRNPGFYQHHRYPPSPHHPPPPQYGAAIHHGGSPRQPAPPNVTVDTVSIMCLSGFFFRQVPGHEQRARRRTRHVWG